MNSFDQPSDWVAILTIAALLLSSLFFVIDARIRKIMAELKPNHGSSMRDAIDRIERRLDDHITTHGTEKQ